MTNPLSLVATARAKLRAFRGDNKGNIAILFGLALLPMVGLAGAAIDYSRGSSARAAMQAALDATGLALSKEAQKLSGEQLAEKALTYFKANFNRSDAQNLEVKTDYADLGNGNYKLDISSSATIATTLTAIWKPTLAISATTQAVWGYKKLELALALDNTGSMSSSGKMTQLKLAAKNLIKILKESVKKEGDIRISIIPFDTTVNLGTSYRDNPWFDWDVWDASNGSCSRGNNNNTQAKCISAGGNWTPKNHSNWEGCVRDRTYPYDTTDNPPQTSVTDSLFPTDDCGSLTTLLPLTSNWTALNNKIDAMTPTGNTNVTIGLVWAWHSLTQAAPLQEGLAPANDLDKVIILLTDGDNTESWKNSNNTKVTSASAINARTELACNNIKAAGIKVYSIRVINGNASLLSKCATNPTMYYNVNNASELDGVFKAIAQSLASLRLAK